MRVYCLCRVVDHKIAVLTAHLTWSYDLSLAGRWDYTSARDYGIRLRPCLMLDGAWLRLLLQPTYLLRESAAVRQLDKYEDQALTDLARLHMLPVNEVRTTHS